MQIQRQTEKQWQENYRKLSKLSRIQLEAIVTAVGIEFEGGNSSLKDTPNMTAQEQFVMVLDEVTDNKLKKAYKRLFNKEL